MRTEGAPNVEEVGRPGPPDARADPAWRPYCSFRSLILRSQVAVAVADGSLSDVAVSVTTARLDDPGVRVT
jgi:hypothetical protein